MAEDNKGTDWTQIGVAVLLFFLSSIISTQIRLLSRIPMGPQAGSASSCLSCVVATFLLASGTGQNPISMIKALF